MPSKIKIEIRAELRDPQGKLIKRYPWKHANSLLKQFIQLLMVHLSQTNQTIKDYLGVDHSINTHATGLSVYGLVTDTTLGIVIGSGTTAVVMTDYKLETQLTTNITHAGVTLAVENPDSSTWRMAISRVLTNNTGATLSIKEVALYMQAGGNYNRHCVDRTLYSVDVPNGVGVTLTYRITVSL